MSLDTVKAILDKAVVHNAAAGLTGFLAFDQHNFLQVLEGGTTKVNELFARISRDPRNHSVHLISFREIETRSFPHFAMGDCDLDAVDRSAIDCYVHSTVFDPSKLLVRDALALLLALEAHRREELATHGL